MFIVTTMPRQSNNNKPVVRQSQPPATIQVQKPTFGDSMKDGFGLGMGSAIAHNLVNRIMAPRPPTKDERCAGYQECLKVVKPKENCDKIFKQCSEE